MYGETQDCTKPLGAVAHFTARILQGNPIEIWGDGTVVRDYVHVDDVTSAILVFCKLFWPSRHLQHRQRQGTSLNELVKLLKTHTALPVNVNYKPSRNFDVAENVLDIKSGDGRIKLAAHDEPGGWSPEDS